MKKYRNHILIIINLVLILLFVNYAIIKKEKTLSEGQLVLLELAPVDPRSLMQGDYMDLRYKITRLESFNEKQDTPKNETISNKGYIVISLGQNNVAKKLRIQSDVKPLNPNEFLLKYHKNKYQIYLGSESYFFEEGNSDKYTKAKYGALKIDKNGNAILVGLYDEKFNKL